MDPDPFSSASVSNPPTFGPIEQSRIRPTSLHDRELRSGQPKEVYCEIRRNSRPESSVKEEHPDKREKREKVTGEGRSDRKRGKHTMPSLATVKESWRHDRYDRELVDLSNKDPKEKLHRNNDLPPPLNSLSRGVEVGSPFRYPIIDITGRNPRERKSSPARVRRISTAAAGAFNPNNVMDLKALREKLNSKETTPNTAPKEPVRTSRQPRIWDPKEVAEIKTIDGRQPRNLLRQTENRKPRIVEEKPVKGILRAPRKGIPRRSGTSS